MRAAIYARVSTERQGREQTIESQLTLLVDWVAREGHTLGERHTYKDEGYSGSRLDRPGLDGLRDAAEDGEFDVVAVLSPDRLARKYAYQVVLIEELRKAGCEVAFLQHPIGDDPNDQLLLQIQGAIAEYERALLGERFRRGKLQKAREGHWIGGRAPYGYTYVPKRDGCPGHLIVNETEAEMVRMLYGWLVEERLTIRQILKRLNSGPWYPRSGKHPWSPSVVQHILSDPMYTGTAYTNRYRFVPPRKPRSPRGPRTSENSCRQPRPKEEWIPIPVPAIITQETHDLAQEQLERNAALSFRNNTKRSYLLRCLLTCKECGLAMFGTCYTGTSDRPERRYYKCHGKDEILSAREHRCSGRSVKAEEIEVAVWDHVAGLLAEPERLLEQFERFAGAGGAGDGREGEEVRRLDGLVARLQREEKRLIDAYQAEVIDLDELASRRKQLAERRRALSAQREQRLRLGEQAARAREAYGDLNAFCERVRSRLDGATFEEKQSILQLLIERIVVGEDTLEIRHVIPLRGPDKGSGGPGPPRVGLRSDGMKTTPLPPSTSYSRRLCEKVQPSP
jgi:site-specific DNA recombinase